MPAPLVALVEQKALQLPKVTGFLSLQPQKSVLNLIALSGRETTFSSPPVPPLVPPVVWALSGEMVERAGIVSWHDTKKRPIKIRPAVFKMLMYVREIIVLYPQRLIELLSKFLSYSIPW